MNDPNTSTETLQNALAFLNEHGGQSSHYNGLAQRYQNEIDRRNASAAGENSGVLSDTRGSNSQCSGLMCHPVGSGGSTVSNRPPQNSLSLFEMMLPIHTQGSSSAVLSSEQAFNFHGRNNLIGGTLITGGTIGFTAPFVPEAALLTGNAGRALSNSKTFRHGCAALMLCGAPETQLISGKVFGVNFGRGRIADTISKIDAGNRLGRIQKQVRNASEASK